MKKTIISLIILIMVSLTLSACMPPGYSEGRKRQITREHSREAKRWFKSNLPEANAQKGEAFDYGGNLYAVIEGKYEYQGQEYEYMYDYHNGNMYLGYDYESARDIAADMMREYFGKNAKAIDLYPPNFTFCTECENDKSFRGNYAEKGDTIHCHGEVLPPGSDPVKYANFMLFGGSEDMYSSFSAKMYVDVIPEYDTSILDAFNGFKKVDFIKTVDLEFDGVYNVSYSYDSASYEYLKLVKISDDLYGGYNYNETIKYDESGEEISRNGVCDHPDEFIKDNGDGSYTIRLLGKDTHFFIFSNKEVKISYTKSNRDGTKETVVLDEKDRYKSKFGNDYDKFYDDINLPKSNYRFYYDSYLCNKYEFTINIE